MRLWLASLALLCARPAAAASPGATGLAFLRTGAGARLVSMGEAGIALGDGVDAAYLNPAALARLSRRELRLNYAQMFEDVQHGQALIAEPTSGYGVWSGRFQYLTYGQVPGFDATGTAAASVAPSDLLGGASWGASPRERLFVGAGLDYLREDLGAVSGQGLALSLGAQYALGRLWDGGPRLDLGLSARDLGPGVRFENRTERLPADVGAGAALHAFADALLLSIDLRRAADRSGVDASAGGEWWIKDVLALRLGYDSTWDAGPGIALGFGVKASRDLEIDYAFTPFSALGDVHQVGLSFRFGGGRAETLYQDGLNAARNGRYAEAILDFDKALARDPAHPLARQALRDAYEKLRAEEERARAPAAPAPR